MAGVEERSTSDQPAVPHARTGVESRGVRLAIAVVVGVISLGYRALLLSHTHVYRADFDQFYNAAQLVLEHRDPYGLIGPGREVPDRWPLLYPMPAILVLTPFTV